MGWEMTVVHPVEQARTGRYCSGGSRLPRWRDSNGRQRCQPGCMTLSTRTPSVSTRAAYPPSSVALRPVNWRQWLVPGALLTVGGAVLIAVVWLTLLPSAPLGDRIGEMLGVEAIWLMSCSIWAMNNRPGRAGWFGGVAGQLWWHRITGAIGITVGIIHPRVMATHGDPTLAIGLMSILEKLSILLVLWAFFAPAGRVGRWRGPLGWIARSSYDTWRILHGVLAVYVGFALYHGLVTGQVTQQSPVLMGIYLAVCAFAAWILVDQMVVRRFRNSHRTGTVTSVTHGDGEAVVTVRPDHDDQTRPGDVIYLGTRPTKERPIPLTVTRVADGELEVVIAAGGRGSTRMLNSLAVGDRVSVSPPQTAPSHGPAPAAQVWVAGGSGIAPMLASLQSLQPDQQVLLIWSHRGTPLQPILAELEARERQHDGLTVRIVDTAVSPRVTGADIVEAAEATAEDIRVRLCGSVSMVGDVYGQLVAVGVPQGHLEVETFNFR